MAFFGIQNYIYVTKCVKQNKKKHTKIREYIENFNRTRKILNKTDFLVGYVMGYGFSFQLSFCENSNLIDLLFVEEHILYRRRRRRSRKYNL